MGAGNAPVYLHRSADIGMAVVDMLISKTFDSSVICPAEQTCVIDEPIYDAVVSEFERLGGHMLDADEVDRLASLAFGADGSVNVGALGQSCVNLGAMADFRVEDGVKVLLAPLPSDLKALAEHPLIQEKLMPVLGLVRSPSVDHARRRLRACNRARWARAHLGRLRLRRHGDRAVRRTGSHRPNPRQRPHRGRGPGGHL